MPNDLTVIVGFPFHGCFVPVGPQTESSEEEDPPFRMAVPTEPLENLVARSAPLTDTPLKVRLIHPNHPPSMLGTGALVDQREQFVKHTFALYIEMGLVYSFIGDLNTCGRWFRFGSPTHWGAPIPECAGSCPWAASDG